MLEPVRSAKLLGGSEGRAHSFGAKRATVLARVCGWARAHVMALAVPHSALHNLDLH